MTQAPIARARPGAADPMHDLAFVGFLLGLIGLGFRRPFLFVLGYVYVDIVSPQRLSYYLLNSIPISLIFFVLAVGGWLAVDDKTGLRMSFRQVLLLLLFMVVSAASIIIVGGIKTLVSGGGYGSLDLGLDDNSGLYEGSIISTVAIAVIPTILFLARHGTVFRPDKRVALFTAALVFACLLIPIGTEARTGLICIGLLAVLMLRDMKRRALYMAGVALVVAVTVPLLPQSYVQRMHTIEGYQADQSASTRLAVWQWTWDYVQDHPFGGGFNAYLQNHLTIRLAEAPGGGPAPANDVAHDQARAYHSAYFEMLGEQGFLGFGLWVLLHLAGLVRMEMLRRRFRRTADPNEAWIAPLATALQNGHLIYLVGALFVGIAFQPFVYMLVAAEIGLDSYIRRVRPRQRPTSMGFVQAAQA